MPFLPPNQQRQSSVHPASYNDNLSIYQNAVAKRSSKLHICVTFNCAINFTPLTSLQIYSNIRLSKTSQIFISFRTSIIRITN